ncbi:Nramp family divalent metal transporter [Mariniblastus fucicola]|uniref:Divalent metal cation transporter MntH n=1 Tax=Mariniblastus fucicola TaxID=980251 RepID=A0A5B9PD21_9BACT|nr:Nramp family divalent metal transporter [Mariniblastus fucicola]QEG20913.1 Divalent metal cation transporter MntH [Mariniblastus fucicola]
MTESNPRRFRLGPGLLVTAAFIGPGTVVTASKAGALYGPSLLWAVAFACLTTIAFQEMAARIGIVSGQGLGQAIRKLIQSPALQFGIAALIVVAILVGNAAYQTGNILGAASGVEIFAQSSEASYFQPWIVGAIGAFAIVIIYLNKFSVLQNVLTGLVVLLSLLFLAAAAISAPPISQIASGLIPSVPKGSLWLLVAVLGTTVVPYNLFLHASLAATLWNDCKTDEQKSIAIRHSRIDTILSVTLGGLVTAAIMLSGSAAFAEARAAGNAEASFSGVASIATQLRPALGDLSSWLFGIGLFAAGLTSAITAPVAAGFAAAGCFGWPNKLTDWRVQAVAAAVVLIGVFAAIWMGGSPQQIIALAQVANGLLLPVLAIFILMIANQKELMSRYVNSKLFNTIAIAMIVVILLLALRQLKGGLGF